MNFISSVTSAQHNNHSGQKVPEYLAQLQQHDALLKESLALSRKALARSQKKSVLQQVLSSLAVMLADLIRLKATGLSNSGSLA